MSYWTVYWFQGFACFVFASTATFSGLTGSALMFPWLIMGYALLPVPEITAVQAVSASIFLEMFAVTIGIYQYHSRRIIDLPTVKALAPFVFLAAILGAVVSHWAPENAIQVVYSLLVLALAWLLLRSVGTDDRQHAGCPDGTTKEMTDARSGQEHRFCAHRLGPQRWVSGGGGFLEGLISAGTGEVTVPRLIMRSGYPIPVAVATSLVLVVVADFTASITHFVRFAAGEGVGEIPWNVIVWGAPGMAAGAYVGSRLQGRFSEERTKKFFSALFAVIGAVFLAFTGFRALS